MAVFDQVPVEDFELSCGHEGREFKNYFGGGGGGGVGVGVGVGVGYGVGREQHKGTIIYTTSLCDSGDSYNIV